MGFGLGHRGRHRRGHHHGGGGRMARFFAHGDLRYLVLHLIADKPRHGYEIIREIEERVGGVYSPSPGVIYPTLTLLAEMGWVTELAGEGGRKQYDITHEGTLALEANKGVVDAVLARMEEAKARSEDDGGRSRHGPHRRAPVLREAIGRLKFVLRRRLRTEELDDAQIESIAAILSQAADDIEKA